MVGKTNLNNKEETRFFCFIIWIDGKVEGYMEPFMPQMQKANTCLYQQCGYIYWIHTVNQAWPPRSRSLKLQSPAGPEDGQQTCWNQGGAGPELALSPYWQPQWATSKSETYPWGSESLLNYLAQIALLYLMPGSVMQPFWFLALPFWSKLSIFIGTQD